MLESFWRHFSPEQLPSDAAAAHASLAAHGVALGGVHDGFFVTSSGQWFSYHFWFYSLLCLPAKAALHVLHADEIGACAWTNALLFVATFALVLRGRVSRARVAFVLLAAASPIVWYVTWPHAEVFEWACVVVSLCAYADRSYGRAAAFAALAAMQTPPIAVLAVVYVGLALARRRFRDAAYAAAAASLAGIAPLFYWVHFRCPSLIVATGMADAHFASASRFATLLFDLDQGMLRFVPVTLLALVIGLWWTPRRNRAQAAVFVLAALVMVAMATETSNFNAGCVGMNRYATWIAPVFAFVGTQHLRFRQRTTRALGFGLLAAQLAIVASINGGDDAHRHNPVATLVLQRAPTLYDPDIETFAERTSNRPLDWPFHSLPLPIAFGPDVTKLLVDEGTLANLGHWFDVRDDWLAAEVAQNAGRSGVFYVEPDGAVRRRPRRPPDREILVLGSGWSFPEGRPGHRFQWMGARGELVVRRSIAGRALRFVGTVPSELASSPTLRVSVGGVEVERYVAPRRPFTRDIVLPVDGPDDVPLTIETSSTVQVNGRQLGFALSSYGPRITQRSIGGDDVHFSGAWHEPSGAPSDETRCMEDDAAITIDPFASARRLWVFATDASTNPRRPSAWTVTLDGHEHESGPVFGMARRVWSLTPNETHTIRFHARRANDAVESDASLCFFALRTTST